MALSVRDRRRIKAIRDVEDESRVRGALKEILEYRHSLGVKVNDPANSISGGGAGAGTTGGAGGGGGGLTSKTNFDLEIKRRYAQTLAAETLEFPTRDSIRDRIEPIACEEGLSGALKPDLLGSLAELVETAAEVYVKETLGLWMGAVRSDGEHLVQTARFKRQCRREEGMVERGEVVRNSVGLLPVEAEMASRREPLGMDDVRVSLRLDHGRLRRDRFLGVEILEDAVGGQVVGTENVVTNGLALTRTESGVNGLGSKDRIGVGDQIDVDDHDYGWSGGSVADRDALMDVLGSVLAVGS